MIALTEESSLQLPELEGHSVDWIQYIVEGSCKEEDKSMQALTQLQ